MPATMHKASSGKPGKINISGKSILLLASTAFCAFSKSFLPISFVANFSPNLSPIKNKIDDEMKFTIMQVINVSFVPNKDRPKTTKEVLRSGTKHNKTKHAVNIIPYINKLYFCVLKTNSLILLKSV